MEKPWNGLVVLEELLVTEKDTNNIIYKKENIRNVLNYGGQSLILSCMFMGTTVPVEYYVGLDNRSTITANQTMADISGEPSGNGYQRQPLVNGTNFEFVPAVTPPKVRSTTISFTGSGAGYSATDMFLCNVNTGYSGLLISTISFGTTLYITAGNVVSMKFAMTLGSC